MDWRLAYSLVQLRDQVNAQWPNRSKASDGTIGDPAHAATASDHNPYKGVVTAMDLTHDPAHGFDAHALADRLIVNRHPNLKYIISNSRIAGAFSNWQWRPYSGTNPHNKHIHISVGVGPDGYSVQPFDDKTNWSINGGSMQPAPYSTARIYAQKLLFRDMTETEWAKFHKDKNRDQLFDAFSTAAEREQKLTYWRSLEKEAVPLPAGKYIVIK